MPSDETLTEDLIATYDEARRVLATGKDTRAVKLLLRSFGDGDGFGVYQLVDETLRAYPRDVVILGLAESLRSDVPSVRAWSMEMALDYPDERLIPQAIENLQSMDRDTRAFAAYFLGRVAAHPAAHLALVKALDSEADEETRTAIEEALGSSDIHRR